MVAIDHVLVASPSQRDLVDVDVCKWTEPTHNQLERWLFLCVVSVRLV